MATIIRIGKTIKTLQFNYGKRIKEEENKGKDLSHLVEYWGWVENTKE